MASDISLPVIQSIPMASGPQYGAVKLIWVMRLWINIHADNRKSCVVQAQAAMARKYDDYKIRYDHVGKLRMIASAEGYVMVRRSGCAPFIMDGKAWIALPREPALTKTESS